MLKCLNNQIGQSTKVYKLGKYQRSDQKALIYGSSEPFEEINVPYTQLANPDTQQQQQILIGQLDNSDSKQEVGKVIGQQIGKIAANTYEQQLSVEPALSDSIAFQNTSAALEERQTGQLQDFLNDTNQFADLLNDILSSEKQCCVQNLGVFILQFALQYNELVIEGITENGQRRFYKPVQQNAPIFVKRTLEKMNYILTLPAEQLDKFLNNKKIWDTVDGLIRAIDQHLTLVEDVFNIIIIAEWQFNTQTPSIFQLLYNLMALFITQQMVQLLMQAKLFVDERVQQFISPIKIDEQQISKELSFSVGQTSEVVGNYDYSTTKLGFDPKYIIDTYSIQLSTYKRQFECTGSKEDFTDELIQWLYSFLEAKYVEQIKNIISQQDEGPYKDLLSAQQVKQTGEPVYQTADQIINTSVTLQNYSQVAKELCNDESFVSKLKNKISQYKANMGQIDVNVIAQTLALNSYQGLPGQQLQNQQQQAGSPTEISIRQQFESNMSGFSQIDVIQQNQQLSIQQNAQAIPNKYKNITTEERAHLIDRLYKQYNWLIIKYPANNGGQQFRNYIGFIVDQLIRVDEPSAQCQKCGAMQNMIYKVALNFDLNTMQVKLITNITQLLFNTLISFETQQLGQLDQSPFEPPNLVNFKQVQSAIRQFVNLFKMEIQKIKELVKICANDPQKLKSELTENQIKDQIEAKLGSDEVYKQLLLSLIKIMNFGESIFDQIAGS